VSGESQVLEGELTRLLYRTLGGRSSLEMRQNYTTEIPSSGVEVVFECRAADCGRVFTAESGRCSIALGPSATSLFPPQRISAKWPCSAALRCKAKASASSSGTPVPQAYEKPRL
jgi:hypothetical protein